MPFTFIILLSGDREPETDMETETERGEVARAHKKRMKETFHNGASKSRY